MDNTTNQVELASDATDALQVGLRRVEDGLLELERAVRLVRNGVMAPRVLTDQAEDLRRSLRILREDHAPVVVDSLGLAQGRLTRAATDGIIDPSKARSISHTVSVVSAETERVVMDLADARRALEPIAQALPHDPGLLTAAVIAIEDAGARVGRSRRAVFQAGEDLPIVVAAMRNIAAEERLTAQLDGLDLQPSPTADRRLQVAPSAREPVSWSQVEAPVVPSR